MSDANKSAQRVFCPGCRNILAQPFVCITCGAQKLHDATLQSQADEIHRLSVERDQLTRELEEWAAMWYKARTELAELK